MKCQILFTGKNKRNVSNCPLLKILPRVLSVKYLWIIVGFFLCTIQTGFSELMSECLVHLSK